MNEENQNMEKLKKAGPNQNMEKLKKAGPIKRAKFSSWNSAAMLAAKQAVHSFVQNCKSINTQCL